MKTLNQPHYKAKSLARLVIFMITCFPIFGTAQPFEELASKDLSSFESTALKDIENYSQLKAPKKDSRLKPNAFPMLEKPKWFDKKNQNLLQGGVVTGGGDDLGQNFQASAAAGLQKLKTNFNADQWKVVIGALEKARFVVVEEPEFITFAGVTQNCVAVNDPTSGLIKISRQRAQQLESDLLMESIGAHEVLSLVHLESTGEYVYSHKILKMIAATSAASNQPQIIFAKYTNRALEGYDLTTAENLCEQYKQAYGRKYYFVYCQYIEKTITHRHARHSGYVEHIYGLKILGHGNPKTLKNKVVFSSLKYGRALDQSDVFATEADAADACMETLENSIPEEKTWIEPNCQVLKQGHQFYYQILTKNPIAN